MDVVNAILKPVVETLMVPVKKHLGYLISSTKYVRDMDIKMTELNAARLSVEEHINRNTRNHLEVPDQARGWLEEIGKVNEKVESVPTDVAGCFNLKMRHAVGRKAFLMIEDIESVKRQHSLIMWTDHPIPLGKVDSKKGSTSTTSTNHHDDFQSREQIFKEALSALDTNHKSHMIALCGMGGVGKTTMMQRLKKFVQENKMFNFIVVAVIGERTDPIAIQEAIADYLGIELKEKTKQARADKLRVWFEANSEGGKKKILVILDDVWQFVDLNDIGLTSLPNQGVDFKVLLTSRNRDVCTMMGVKANSVLNVKVLTEAESQSFFSQFVEIDNHELQKIGEDIVSKCCGLPIAIKTMACTLRNKSKDAWKDALSRLQHHDMDEVMNQVFEMSYNCLQDEDTKSIFLLCALFPEDFNIPTEELVRYGWGLKLFKRRDTIIEVRTRLNTCIEQLINTNLLMESDDVGCVKMHDLVRAFVLGMFSKVENASIVNHGSMSGWPENDTRSSCKRISLTCKGISEIPKDLKFPNLKILKLMQGDKSLRFPEDLFGEMKSLEVLSFDQMKHLLLPPSPQCSTNLRVLHLHECSLTFDCSSIGNLLNLEVLSFANSGIEWLPSSIGNLKKLKLLDLTRCGALRIDNGVLKNLVRLEELYVKVTYLKTIGFTDDNYNEMAERSKSLSALQFDFLKDNPQLKNMTFENLERFKISVGRSFSTSSHLFENTLQLVTNKSEILESRLNKLFEKTEVLCLSVCDMHDLSDLEVKSSSFYNLRVLVVAKCPELKYLFTIGVAKALTKLEHLEVFNCRVMEELISTEGTGVETITFPNLKSLSLRRLQNLSGLCNMADAVELPQLIELELGRIPNFTSIYSKNKLATSCLLKEEVVIPKLEKLKIEDMRNLKEIWPCEFNSSEELNLREIEVRNCENLVNLFPCNPMSMVRHLTDLKVEKCGSIETLFNIDLDCVGEIGKEGSSNLRSIIARNCDNLVNLFPCNPMSLLHHLEELQVEDCGSIEMLFNIDLDCVGEIGKGSSNLRSIKVRNCDNLVHLFPCNPMSLLHHLEELQVENCGSVEVLFNIDLDCVGDGGEHSNLRNIQVKELGKLREVWKIKGGNNSRPLICGFQGVEYIDIRKCKSFRNIMTPTTTNFDLGALVSISIHDCGESGWSWNNELSEHNQGEEETDILSKEETSQVSDGIYDVVFPSSLTHSFPSLRKLDLSGCEGVEVVFEIDCPTSKELVSTHHNQQGLLPHLEKLDISDMAMMSHIWKCNWNKFLILQKQESRAPFHNLTTIHVNNCNKIKYLFSPLMAKYLSNLNKVEIEFCFGIEEVVSNRDDVDEEKTTSTSTHTNTSLLPRLHSLILRYLGNLKCIGGGGCANGENNEIPSNNSSNTTAFVGQFQNSQVGGASWSLCQYSREITIIGCKALSSVIPSYAVGQMQKLQFLRVKSCDSMKEVFETQGINKGGCGSSTSNDDEGRGGTRVIPTKIKVIMLTLPNLRVLEIEECGLLEYIFTFSAVESLTQLEELTIKKCKAMKVIVKEEDDGEQTTKASKVVVFPRLKSVALVDLPDLMGFFLGMNEFRLPSLDDVTIKNCPQMLAFIPGRLTTPKLKYIQTSLGTYSLEDGLNFDVTTTSHHQTSILSLDGTSSGRATSEGVPWSFRNLIKLDVEFNTSVEKIIPSSELLQLHKLESIHVKGCDLVEEVFEALEWGTNSSDFDESHTTVVKLPNLRKMDLDCLFRLRHMWKSNQWTLFQFPNLTKVSIHGCHSLKEVFSYSMVDSLLQLQELHITYCNHMEEVIVKDTNVAVDKEDGNINEITLSCLKSLILDGLPCLKGFCLGKEDFSLPLLDTLRIEKCPAVTIFTTGNVATPKLKEIETNFGLFYAGEDINSFIEIKQEEFKRGII